MSNGVEKTPPTVANNTTGEAGGETSRTPAQSIPNDPKTISATTERSPLAELLFANFVYYGTYTVQTDYKPGAIIFAIPVHPSSANQYNAHVLKMFNAWNGSLLLRTRFASSALYGGLIRIVHLPPNLTRDDINRMSIKNMTAYPNIEVNPQNTEWSLIKGEDERNMLFHYTKEGIDENDPTTFGGWIVAFVEAALIASSDGSQSVGLVVETCGRFLYNQPNPFFTVDSNTPSANDPLPDYLLYDICNSGLSSVDLNPFDTILTTWQADATIDKTRITIGTMTTGKSGLKEPYEYTSSDPGALAPFRQALLDADVLPQVLRNVIVVGEEADIASIVGRPDMGGALSDAFPIDAILVYERAVGAGEPGCTVCTLNTRNSENQQFGYHYNSANNEAVTGQNLGITFQPNFFYDANPNFNYMSLFNMTVDPYILCWFSASYSAVSTMTAAMARYMNYATDFIPLSETQSWSYILMDTNLGVAIAFVRLCPNGIWTTSYPNNYLTDVGQRVHLEFNATIPLDEALPPLTATMKYHRNFMRAHTKPALQTNQKPILKISTRARMTYENDMALHALAGRRK